jgi:hypothetical protein
MFAAPTDIISVIREKEKMGGSLACTLKGGLSVTKSSVFICTGNKTKLCYISGAVCWGGLKQGNSCRLLKRSDFISRVRLGETTDTHLSHQEGSTGRDDRHISLISRVHLGETTDTSFSSAEFNWERRQTHFSHQQGSTGRDNASLSSAGLKWERNFFAACVGC